MRKIIILFLLVAGTASTLPAQNTWNYYYEPFTTNAEALFNSPKPGKAKVNFNFTSPVGGGWIKLELVSIKQMQYLPDLDSILNIAKSSLRFIADSLKEDGINRRIDLLINKNMPVQIRITNHTERPATYFIQHDELALLKTEQDTLRIKTFVATGRKTTFRDKDGVLKTKDDYQPAFIMITMNSFDKLQTLPENTMQTCLSLLRQDITADYVQKASAIAQYSAFYNLQTNKRFSPSKPKWIKYGYYRNELVPNIYGSLQFVRGNFAPSIAAGLRFTNSRSANITSRFYLMWEPYFFFRRDAGNKLVTERNDFVTFRYIRNEESDRKKGSFEYVGNFSIGYLFYKKGEWFEKNTIKLGLPGVRSGWLQLEPELYFNNFMKNFSPTLKLTLHYE